MRILSLDLGDRWVGSALSDALQMTCKPYKTVDINDLEAFLATTLEQEQVGIVVVGYPKTFSGGASEQTRKIEALKQELEKKFGEIQGKKINWILWDERLSSKRAEQLHKGDISSEAKRKNHSIAAAFILQSYLDSLAFGKMI